MATSDKYETHNVVHNEFSIEVKILIRSGLYLPLSYVVFCGKEAINHRLSDTQINKFEKIISDYCFDINKNYH